MATVKEKMVEVYGISLPEHQANCVKLVADGLVQYQRKENRDITLENRLNKTAVKKAIEYLTDFEQFMYLYGGD